MSRDPDDMADLLTAVGGCLRRSFPPDLDFVLIVTQRDGNAHAFVASTKKQEMIATLQSVIEVASAQIEGAN